MTDFVLSLGGVEFYDFEVPDVIKGFGGELVRNKHFLPGGARTFDSMGVDDGLLQWSGRFRTASAIARARQIEALFRAGQTIDLSAGDIQETVLIADFRYDVERLYEVPYTISLEVISDQTVTTTGPDVDDMMGQDNATAQGLGAVIGDGPLSGLLGTLDTAISGVTSFATAAQAEINTVLAPIQQVQSRVTTLISTANNTLQSVTTLGGVLPNNPASTIAAQLTGQAAAMTQVSALYQLQAVAGRMQGNLAAVGGSGAQVTVAGGNLFDVAEDAYGDATAWATIAAANGLTDPVLTGVQTILVPPSGGDTGGVLD